MCGEQLVLVDGNDTELLTEDTRGMVYIPNNLFIKGNIADRVQSNFMTKMGIYYKKFSKFLSTLDVKNIEIDTANGIVETPIEDFVQIELPTTFIKYYGVQAVYKSILDNKGKQHDILDHFELKRNNRIDSFDEIFNYTVENWKKFKRCIQGQNRFLAWSNDPSEIAVSHWQPEEIKTMPQAWSDFLQDKMKSHFMMRLITYLGMCMDAENSSQQYLIISDKGGTGKGVMARALESALPKGSIAPLDENSLADSNEFGLSGIKVWNSHISLMEEYKTNNLCSNRAKKFIANNPMDLNVKGRNFVHWEPYNHKLIVFSNTGAIIKDFANRRRAIPISFENKFEWTKEKQEALNSTAKDFLNYCYTVYKKCPMLKNGNYLVLSEEDEKDYMAGKLTENDEEILSKRAFNEDSLREYFKTDEAAGYFRDAFEIFLNKPEDAAILFHCAGGKDRTGIVSMLLLSALDFDKDIIMQDYMMTNTANAKQIEEVTAAAEEYTDDPELRYNIIYSAAVYPELMEENIDYFTKQYGSVKGFLREKAGLTDEDFAKLKELYLED